MTRILPRPIPGRAVSRLLDAGTHPLLARIYAARGIDNRDQLDYSLKALLPPPVAPGGSRRRPSSRSRHSRKRCAAVPPR